MEKVFRSPSDKVPQGWGVSVITQDEDLDGKPFRVVVDTDVDRAAVAILEGRLGFSVEHLQEKFTEDLMRVLLQDTDNPVKGLIVRTKGHDVLMNVVDEFEQNHALEIVVRAGIGVADELALKALQNCITFINTPEPNRDTVHRETIKDIMRCLQVTEVNARETYRQAMGWQTPQWKTETRVFTAQEQAEPWKGKVLYVLGAGGIGERVMYDAHKMGMNVLYTDIDPSRQFYFAEQVPLHEGLGRADVISVHVNKEKLVLGPEQFEFINPDMDRRVLFFNTSRGKVVDTPSLIASLKSGRIDGGWVDVLDHESADAYVNEHTRELMQLQGLMKVTRHMLGGRVEALHDNAVDAAYKLVGAVRSGVVQDAYGGANTELPKHMWSNGSSVYTVEIRNESIENVHGDLFQILKGMVEEEYQQKVNIGDTDWDESNFKVKSKVTGEQVRIAHRLSKLKLPAEVTPEFLRRVIRTCLAEVPGLRDLKFRHYYRREA